MAFNKPRSGFTRSQTPPTSPQQSAGNSAPRIYDTHATPSMESHTYPMRIMEQAPLCVKVLKPLIFYIDTTFLMTKVNSLAEHVMLNSSGCSPVARRASHQPAAWPHEHLQRAGWGPMSSSQGTDL